ncbi:MAG: hypothetical protein ACOC8N_08850 [Spirochaetota bacterium]
MKEMLKLLAKGMLPVIAAAGLVVGCAGMPTGGSTESGIATPGAGASGDGTGGKQDQAVSAGAAESGQAAEEREGVPLLVRESVYLPGGGLDEYTVYTYREGNLVREERFTAGGGLLESTSYQYEEGLLKKKTLLRADGSVNAWHEYRYDEEGLLSADTLCSGTGGVRSRSVYRYDASGRRERWSVYDDRENLLGYTEYRYRDGKLARKNIHGADGGLERYSILEYDRQGRPAREVFHRADGTVVRQVQFQYFEDRLVAEVHTDGGGQLMWKLSYDYGEQETVSRITYVGGDGEIREIIERSYRLYPAPPEGS